MTETKSQSRRANPRIVLALCSGATFIAFLDLSVVNIALPSVLEQYPTTSIDSLSWIVSAYSVAFAALLTTAGRIADISGRKRLYLISLVAFTLASLLCGLAPNVEWLIAARIVQGASAAGMIPAALGLILSTTPREEIARSIGAWSATAGFSAVVGPAIGGILVESFGWRSVFVINVPIGLALVAISARHLPRSLAAEGRSGIPDFLGTVALTLGIGGVVTALTEGHAWGWTSLLTSGTFAIGAVLVAAAWWRSRRHAAPAIDVSLWRNSTYAMCNVASVLLGASMFAWLIGGPLFAETIWQWSTLQTAGALTIGAVTSMIGSTVGGRVKSPVGQRGAAIVGALLFAVSNAIWASPLFGSTPNLWTGWVPAALSGGFGLGLALTALSSAAAAEVPPQKFAVGIGMNLTARQIGGATGAAALAAIMASNADPTSLEAFHAVYGFATVVAVLAAIAVSITRRRAGGARPR